MGPVDNVSSENGQKWVKYVGYFMQLDELANSYLH